MTITFSWLAMLGMLVVAAVWLLAFRRSSSSEFDLGAVSGGWIAQHRTDEL